MASSDSAHDGRNRRSSHAAAIVAATAVVAALSLVFAPGAFGQINLRASASDDRATFVPGNVSTCAAAGFPNTIQFGSPRNTSVTGTLLKGTVQTNAGPVQTGKGQELNVEIITPGTVEILAIIVKGSDGYNLYTNPAVLPPQLNPDQHYISPINNGGNVPDISHWFVCYNLTTPPPAGSISLAKTVIAPNGVPVQPLPTSFLADVTCNGRSQSVEFSAGGGSGTPRPALTGLAVGTSCTVTEQDTGSFPQGTVVSYSPSQPVTITGDEGVTVTIINDFSGVAVQHGRVELHKVVDNPSDLPAPANFTATVACNDGPDGTVGTNETVTMPGTGGVGTPPVEPKVGAECAVEEDPTSVPAGWTVSYSLDGGPASSEPPVFTVASDTQTISITITNTAAAPPPATGMLTVFKTVIPPNPPGVPVTPLPTGFTALVNCDDENSAHQNVTVTFPASGGQGTPQLTGIPVGTRCTVVEQSRPANAVVTYFPTGANTTGVVIGEGPGVEVGVRNDFSDAPLRTGTIRVEKVVHNPAGMPTPANFTAHVVCQDGRDGAVGTDVHVTLPGGGGAGSPVVHPKLGFLCGVTETTRPAGWIATYTVDGRSTGTAPATFRVTTDTPSVTVTITNTAPPARPPSTSPFVPGPGATGDVSPDRGPLWALLGAAAVVMGVAAGLIVRFRRGRGWHS